MTVIDAIDKFFATQGFMPHGLCLLWRPSILWTMVAGNAVIAFSYFMIPVALIYLILKRKDIGFKWIFALFGAFILACGMTHVMGIVVLWYPMYGLEALILALTGIVSLLTAILLWPLLPVLFKIPSPWLLEQMNNNLKKTNEALAKTEIMQSKLAAIVEFTEDAIISESLEDIITSWNDGAERLYGYQAQEVIGKSIAIIFPDDRLKELHEIARKIKAGQPLRYLETERKHKDGHLIPTSITISPLKDKAGQLIGACSIARDITEWKQIQKMKNEFISIVSHELRTPLTSVQGSLALLVAGVAGELPYKAQKLLQIGKQNTERLIRLINDILDITKIEAGRMDFNIKQLEIDSLVKEAITLNQSYALKYGVHIKLEDHASALVNADHDRLLQVITNLLSNAIKFSPPSESVIVKIDTNKDKVIVAITNKGEGIPQEFKSNIFKKFSQANTTTSRSHQGTGLGLSISKEIIERHQGSIGFTSEPNQGTTFFFELPIATKLLASQRVFEKIPVVLICQDDIKTSHELKLFLEKNNFKVIITNTSKEVTTILDEQHVDALLLDLMMTDTDGISFVKELRARYTALELPIIVISFMTQKGKEELNGNAFSILDWIEKPVNIDRLYKDIQLIKKHIEVQTPNILFIEDEVDLIEVIAHLAQGEANIIGVTNLEDARIALEKQKFDLVILDLLLPDGSGVDLLPEISEKNIPVIVFSAYELPRNYAHYVIKTLMKSKTSPHEFLKVIRASLFNQKLMPSKIDND